MSEKLAILNMQNIYITVELLVHLKRPSLSAVHTQTASVISKFDRPMLLPLTQRISFKRLYL